MKNIFKDLLFILLFITTCSCVSIKRHHEVRDRLLDNLMSCESSLLKTQETIGNMKNLRNACEERNKSFEDALFLCKKREDGLRKTMREDCFK